MLYNLSEEKYLIYDVCAESKLLSNCVFQTMECTYFTRGLHKKMYLGRVNTKKFLPILNLSSLGTHRTSPSLFTSSYRYHDLIESNTEWKNETCQRSHIFLLTSSGYVYVGKSGSLNNAKSHNVGSDILRFMKVTLLFLSRHTLLQSRYAVKAFLTSKGI